MALFNDTFSVVVLYSVQNSISTQLSIAEFTPIQLSLLQQSFSIITLVSILLLKPPLEAVY